MCISNGSSLYALVIVLYYFNSFSSKMASKFDKFAVRAILATILRWGILVCLAMLIINGIVSYLEIAVSGEKVLFLFIFFLVQSEREFPARQVAPVSWVGSDGSL